MSKITGVPKLGMTVTLDLTEGEARFLEALLSYGGRALIDAAYANLGRLDIEPYEKDGLSFCQDALRDLRLVLSQIDRARKAFTNPNFGKPTPAIAQGGRDA